MICEAAIEHASRLLAPEQDQLRDRLSFRATLLPSQVDTTIFGQSYGEDCNAAAVWEQLGYALWMPS